jgi:ADP-heptose:LPS heptosyltransferase
MQQIVFHATSRVTDFAPKYGRHVLNALFRPYGSKPVIALYAYANRRRVRRVRAFGRFLVVADIHIGDAVMSQATVTALRDYFPDATIDYVVNRSVAPLIDGNPEVTRVIPLFGGSVLPRAEDALYLSALIRNGAYDLCFCSSPFLEAADLGVADQPFFHILSHGASVLHNERTPQPVNHFSYQGYRFAYDLLATVARPVRDQPFPGVRTTHDHRAIWEALRFAHAAGLTTGGPVVMHNPDSASPYTLVPFDDQVGLARALLEGTSPACQLAVGAGHTAAGIGERIIAALPEGLRDRTRLVPTALSLPAYSALIDHADVFISGDTGPLHLAAARRHARGAHHVFRNRTAVLSLFGATPPRMSGYDSEQPGYLPANQDAPSWCYQAESPCRNITCVNKIFKTCATPRCFARVDTAAIAGILIRHLRTLPLH